MSHNDKPYYLQWFQFPEIESSWEPEENVTAGNLVEKFWKDVKVNKEQFDGQVILASEEYIGGWQCTLDFYELLKRVYYTAASRKHFVENGAHL